MNQPGRPLRVALLSESDVIGGAETMISHLARGLRERGHEVHFVGPRNGSGWLGGVLAREGFQTHEFHLRRALDPMCLRHLARIFRANEFDVAHSHMFAMAVYGAGAARLAHRPHVITMHGDAEQTRFWRRRAALRWAFRKSQAVLTVANDMRSDLIRTLGSGVGEIGVVVNGVPGEKGERERIRRELDIEPNEYFVVAVGSCCKRKAHLDLLAALEPLADTIPWRAAIAGPPGDASDALKTFVEDRRWEDRAQLLGPREDVRDLLAASDLFVMPSLWEGLPLALLEAMFSEKPIISTTAGGIPETVRDGEDAVLVPPGDSERLSTAIRTMFQQPERAARLARSARVAAEARFGIARMVERYERIYYSAMGTTQ